jgi:hypothetical protein
MEGGAAVIPTVDLVTLEAQVDRLDESATRELAARLREHLRPVTPVTPATRQAFECLGRGDEGPPEVVDAVEAHRDDVEAEFFALDADNDDEAPVVFRQARALSALLHAIKGVYADAVYEAQMAVEDPDAMLTAMNLGPSSR